MQRAARRTPSNHRRSVFRATGPGLGYVLLVMLGGCCHVKPPPGGPTVSLEPDDPRPVVSVNVADSDEAELLVQELDLEVVRVSDGALYFFESEAARPSLEKLGYQLTRRNLYDVYRRVVRMDDAVAEEELPRLGVQLINRERNGFTVVGSLAALRALERAGARLRPIGDPGPRPRQIKLVVESTEDVRRIGAMDVDIYSAERRRGDPAPEEIEGQTSAQTRYITVFGAAFDYQIDRLEAAGYSVERLPTSNPGGDDR
ncbi:MAG: hypothetical protein AAFY88_17805 [Acidobacteriota bacterium]